MFRKDKVMQPFTFEYELASLQSVLQAMLRHTHPFLFPYMPFNYLLFEADKEAVIYLNQDKNRCLHIPVGGGVIEASHIVLWNWKIKNLFLGPNKVHVTVQKE